MQYDWCLQKEGKFGQRDTHTSSLGEFHVKVKAEIEVGMLLYTKEP